MKFTFLYILFSPPRNPDLLKLPLVPPQFVNIFRGTLAKMAGEKIIPYEFVDLDFWNTFPRRFNSKKTYQNSKVFLTLCHFAYFSIIIF